VSGCRRWLVSGRVQGVFFRASTRERAVVLGLTALETWLHHGPPAAKVEGVVGQAHAIDPPQRFTTG
jgi:acylphosphatase